MPWRELEPMEQRLELIREYERGLVTMTERVAQYGVSRKTAYKWLARYDRDGVRGLADRSRRPQASPQALAPEIVDAVVAFRRRHPRWGPKKLLRILRRRHPAVAWPHRSTVCAWRHARGLVASRRQPSPLSAAAVAAAPSHRTQ